MNAADAAKQVAKDHLGIESFVMQNRDSLDFKSFNVAEIKFALVAAFKLGQQHPKAEEETRWYCFDAFDSFGPHNTAVEAAEQLESMKRDGLTGLHMMELTAEQFLKYCEDGKHPFSK